MSAHDTLTDPYHRLFQQLSAGAARCRSSFDGAHVASVEIVDSNPAFAAVRDAIPQLLETFATAHASRSPATHELRVGGTALCATVYPAGADEAIVVLEDVTARDRLEQRSRASEGRFELAFHGHAAAMVIAHQRDLRIIDVNPRWLELFGVTRAEVIGRTPVELGLISESAALTRIAQHRQFSTGYDIELELRTRAGRPLTVLASAKPIEIEEGTCTLTTLIDITGRKHAEEAFAVAFSASPAGMMLVDAATSMVVAVNNRLLDMTRFDRDELVGHDAAELGLIREPPRSELLAEVARTGRLDAVEVELARKHTGATPDDPAWALASTEMITLHDKAHRLTVFTDIADRKRFERRLLAQHAVGRCLAEARDLEAAVPPVLEALCRGDRWDCGAMWLPDADGSGLRCRGLWPEPDVPDELGEITRRTIPVVAAGILGSVLATGAIRAFALETGAGPFSKAAFAAGMRAAIAFPVLHGADVCGVVVLATRGKPPPLDEGQRTLCDSVGRLLGLFVERTTAEAALRELNADLERRVLARTQALETSNRDLDAFSSSVSHDLRAPLRAIHGFSELLLEDYGATLPAEAKQFLTRINASGARLRQLIDDLLSFARVGRNGLRRIDLDLDGLVRSVLDELLAGRALGERLQLRMMPLGRCHADPSLLRSVWTNLIDNALKYSREREPIVVEIGREARGAETVYYVRDNGVGFDMKYADRLFGVFQRLHSAAEFEGTGVGLANVRRIIECHHGRVAASSELGHGSRFEFTLGQAEPEAVS